MILEPVKERTRRWVVVGDEAVASELRALSGGVVVSVEDYYQALGELASGGVCGLVGRVGLMSGVMESMVSGLRGLCDGAGLFLLVEPFEEPEAMRAVRLGFNDYFVEPCGGEELWRGMREAVGVAAGSGGDVELSELGEAEEFGAVSGGEYAGDGNDDDEGMLLDYLLMQRRGFDGLVVGLVSKRVGCNDVKLTEEAVVGAKVSVGVFYESKRFGFLSSSMCGEEELCEQAKWAGRWLAMWKHVGDLQYMALHDEMTRVWNRRYFERFLSAVVRRAYEERFRVTLLLFDIDNFKTYNDQYGHPAGDEILRETARLMQSLVRKQDVVARVGGDEFAVIFWDTGEKRRNDSEHPREIQRATARFQKAICEYKFPKLIDLAVGTLTISGGLASYPWDGQTVESLMSIADEMLLKSKRQGKNAITFGPGALKMFDGDDEQG